MKKALLITLLLIVGCSKEPINYETTLVERDGVYFTKDTNKPYSAPVFSLYKDGEKKEDGNIKDGKKDGLWNTWYGNGQKRYEKTYKEGKEDGRWNQWYRNGQKKSEETYKDGELDGLLTTWYESGKKRNEQTWKNGTVDEKWTVWHENGQKEWEGTIKDGNFISEECWDKDGNERDCN